MKAVLFCRVSSKDQEETGYSLSAQEKLLKSYAEKKDFNVAKVYSISESASGKKQREMFCEMMRFVQKNNIKIIVCEKVDRLTRNFRDAVMIDEWLEKHEERQIHLVKDNLMLHKNSRSQEKFNWGIGILIAKNYIDNLSEEVKKGQQEKLSQGHLPGKPPIGYKTIGDSGHKIHVIDEDKAPLIRKMFELHATGNHSLTSLSMEMYKLGLRNALGKKYVKSRIHQLLTEPFYYGKIRWNNKIYDGKHEPIISKELFDRVQVILKRRNAPKYSKHFYLFKGLVKCAECGGSITWEKQKNIVYGHCNRYRNCTQKTYYKEYELENKIQEVFGDLQIKNTRIVEWIRKALKESHKDEIDFYNTSLSELNRRKEQIERRLDVLYDDRLDEKITEDFYENKFKQYSDEKEQIIQSISKYSQANNKYFELGMNIYELSQRAKEIYQRANLDEKRQLISLVFSNLALSDGKLNFTYSVPFKILSEAVCATNSSNVANLGENYEGKFEPEKNTDLLGKNANLAKERSVWLGREDSNLRIRDPNSRALPLGHSPLF